MKESTGISEDAIARKPLCICGKIGFDKKTAQSKRNWLLKKGTIKELRIYQCNQSDYWHLTKAMWHDDTL